MSRRWTLRAFLVSATLVISQAVLPGAARASGSCGDGTLFLGTTAGTIAPYDHHWYETPSTGETTITLQSPSGYPLELRVFTGNCSSPACDVWISPTLTCTVEHTGLLYVDVWAAYGNYTPYTLTSSAFAGVLPSCDGLVCLSVTPGERIQTVSVGGVTTVPGLANHVVGSVDLFRFDLPTGGSAVLPCAEVTFNATVVSPCRTAGGTFVGHVATLYDGPLDVPSVSVGVPLVSAGLCEALVTAKVAGIGVEDVPAYTLC
ncbi:MAG: hypothetical protein QOE45_997 [Frankiaceae bacterium]|jgi:hypothetical protein|nr:hypothetical protein [Frankiaceae bacterium]